MVNSAINWEDNGSIQHWEIISQCRIHIPFFVSIVGKCHAIPGVTLAIVQSFSAFQSVNMEKNQATVSKQTLYLSVLVVFIAGFICGVVFSVMKSNTGSTVWPVKPIA